MSPSKQPRDLIRVGVITGPAGHTNPIWGAGTANWRSFRTTSILTVASDPY